MTTTGVGSVVEVADLVGGAWVGLIWFVCTGSVTTL